MITENDDRNGIVKISWTKIRTRVEKVEPTFAKLVDQLNPDKTFNMYLVYLPYGALKGDTKSTYFPDGRGHYYRLSDHLAPKELVEQLGYGIDGSPMGMILDKEFEYFIDLKHKGITIPWLIYKPGQFFPLSTILGCQSSHTYAPNGLLTVTSGARSTFMLPNIGCNTHHINLKREFNITIQAPKSLYSHWYIFKEILNSNVYENGWRSCLLYFGKKWVEKIRNDTAWMELKLYLHELAWRKFEYERNKIYYEMSFSLIQEKRNLKPNPYLTDTARHLFAMALGAVPGYIPAYNEEAIPINLIQKAFIDAYGLKKYIPTIMHATHFNFEKDKLPIYYSFQNPSTHVFSPKSRTVSSTLTEMLELEHIMGIFCQELADKSTICSDTIIGEIAKSVTFDYFHNKVDRQKIIHLSTQMPEMDKRFLQCDLLPNNSESIFAGDAPFVRGCVSISAKHLI